MKFLINASNLIIGGGIQVGNAFIRELRVHPEHEYFVVCSEQMARSLGDLKNFPDFIQIKVAPQQNMIDKLRRIIRVNPFLDRCVKEFSADAVFTIFGPSYWKPRVPHLCGYAKPHYIYLDSPFFKTLSFSQSVKIKINKWCHLKSFRNDADMLVTENPDVSEKLSALCPHKKIVTVSNCCNPIFDTPDDQTAYGFPTFEGITLLTIAANYPHKNLRILPEVAAYLRSKHPDFKFRIVLSQPDGILSLPDSLKDHFLFVGKIEVQQLPSFYRQSDFMILPTLLECFSASWVEAMKSSVPILTSDLPFAHGICGDAAVYFNPMDPADIGEKIVELANNKSRQNELIERGKEQLTHFYNNSTRTSLYLSYLEGLAKK